jgi:signal transduction histidine kinase/CheY-like chemotaxis protein
MAGNMAPEKISLPDKAESPAAPPRIGFEAKVLSAFGAAALVVALLAAGTWNLAWEAENEALRVSHTHEVLVSLARVRADSVQIELSTQSFRITGDASRLAERDAALAAREASLRQIAELTADNPRQQALLKRLRDTVEERKAISRRVEALRKSEGEAAASAYIAVAPVRETQARLLGLLTEMKDEERHLLAERKASHDRSRTFALAAAAFAALALFALFAGTYALIRRQLRAIEASRRALAEREAALREANAALDRANRMKSEFLASMSHELRTPLNAVIGFSEVLRDGLAGEVSEQQREYLQDILSSGTHLLALINDILDLSKVEAGRMELELDCLPVESLLHSALSIVREKAMAHRLTLDFKAADAGELCADARKVKQIVYNLLSNAVKFTPDGGSVTLGARRVPRQAAPAAAAPPEGTREFIEIAVADSGIGISAEDQTRLFAPFTQLDSSLSRQYAGTGLGLALVKGLAELHGGAVGVESVPGKGSTFRVWLPCRPEADGLAGRQRAVSPAARLRGKRVLVVEDDAQSFELLRITLTQEGFVIAHAANAREARTKLETESFDLITLDILLPGEDGWQFLDALKKNAALAHIPVVVASIVAEEEKGFALGASAVLQKPFAKDELISALAGLGFVAPRGPARVLVVDDDPAAVELAAVLLAAEGHAVERAYGGREGVEKALAAPPDLILLDLMMPDLSGFEAVTRLRADPRTAATPIIVVTAKTLDEAERRELDRQVQAVLEKSRYTPEAFLAEVRRALSARRNK